MGYQAVYLVEHGYRDEPFRFINADENGLIITEPWDGNRIRRYFAEGIYLNRRAPGAQEEREILFYAQTPVEFLISDSRVMLRIERYKECYHHDDTMAAVLRGGMEKIPAYRRDELILMGMIRYEWLSQISYEQKVSFSTQETVRLYYKDQNEFTWFLDVVFGKESDAEYLANEILHRACGYRMKMADEKDDKEIVFFTQYGSRYEIEPSDDPKNHMASVRFPTQYPAPSGEGVRPPLG